MFVLIMNGCHIEIDAHRLNDGGLLLSYNGNSYTTYLKEEVDRCVGGAGAHCGRGMHSLPVGAQKAKLACAQVHGEFPGGSWGCWGRSPPGWNSVPLPGFQGGLSGGERLSRDLEGFRAEGAWLQLIAWEARDGAPAAPVGMGTLQRIRSF